MSVGGTSGRDRRATHERIEVVAELLGRETRATSIATPRRATIAEELTEPDDVYADYVRGPYEPAASPVGKLRAVNLLYESFALMGVEDRGVALVASLRRALGQGATVFGVKHHEGALSWELYFYDPERRDPRFAIDAIRAAMAPIVDVRARVARSLAWHMFSIELRAEHFAGAPVERLQVYVNGLDGHGASRSYAWALDAFRLENLYTFHDPRAQIRDVIGRLRASTHLDLDRTTIAAALWPELFRCRRLCVANKPASDGMYFSGVSVERAVFMARALAWPAALADYLHARRERLDHLRFDVGFDFATPPEGGPPRIAKSALYATF